MESLATQRIVKIRRDYNRWVADETLEDYALRFTARTSRKWSEAWIANTALGAVSFLALEAIGGAITLSYGFANAFWAIVCVSVVIFLTGLPISYYAARYGVDMDLLTRGAGFGYLGSTITSLIYASFTFIFFALEASIMAQAIELYFGLPLAIGYVVCALVVIPFVIHGITLISKLQVWTQPLWLFLLLLPYACVLYREPAAFADLTSFAGHAETGSSIDLLLFGAAATVAFSLIAQIGEQVDFLRFLPEKTPLNRRRWWKALLLAGPGWIVPGAAKMLGGALLTFLAIQQQVPQDKTVEPMQMYLVAYGYVFSNPAWSMAAATLLVVLCQVKINVTNAYAGSLAWSNFFARLTHSHPGRVVWLGFNVLIAVLLMEVGVFKALEHVLGVYSLIAISWIGAVVSDLVINKPLGLSPPHIEFRRAYLHAINPVGVGAMVIASLLAGLAHAGLFGVRMQALSPFVALAAALACAPLIAVLTRGRYYMARVDDSMAHPTGAGLCVVCENRFEQEDMAQCPAYQGAICSLCCSLDARCHDRCKTAPRLMEEIGAVLARLLPIPMSAGAGRRIGQYLSVFALLSAVLTAVVWLLYDQELASFSGLATLMPESLRGIFIKLFSALLLLAAVASWWLVLSNESRQVAQQESERQTNLLLQEIQAHRETDAKLQRAKEAAEAANLAKSRYVTGMSHELRTPLNGILGYAQILQADDAIPQHRREAIAVIKRSGDHLLSLIDGLLDIARIEAGRMRLDNDELALADFLDQLSAMFAPQAAEKGLSFRCEIGGRLPVVVHVDQKRLRQILINLLGNAIKFTENGSVTLRVHYVRQLAQFEVIDTGIGIRSEEIERIFLPFERSSDAASSGAVGTGLGLAISSMLAHIMGGELTATSNIGSGSRFVLKLYLPEVHAPRPKLTLQDHILGYHGVRRRLLVVDDQAQQRQLLRDMLVPLGFDVVEAECATGCMEAIAASSVDLLLLDIAMPMVDGWAIRDRIRAAGHIALPIIFVSANAIDGPFGKTEPQGKEAFVTKPVLIPALLDAIRRQLGIDWIIRQPTTSATTEALRESTVRLLPPRADLEALLQAGMIGHVKGIVQQLDRLDQRNSGYLAFTGELRELIKRFRLNAYEQHLRKVIGHDMDTFQ